MIPHPRGCKPHCRAAVCYPERMNFLAHLVLAGDNEDLRLGALLGDFVRGNRALEQYPAALRRGIRLHRHIDAFTDELPEVVALRRTFDKPFRRYSGILIDLGLDHELARHWDRYSKVALEQFDRDVRTLLDRRSEYVPERLKRFMAYADRRGLFASYASREEVLHSLRGVGRRLSRPNPLHRADEIWDEFEPRLATAFEPVFAAVQSAVRSWLNTKSTTTGS